METSNESFLQALRSLSEAASRRDGKGEGTFDLGNPELPEPVDGFVDFGHLSLRGLPNTRDLGGMPAADGRVVVANRLIRSGDLHKAASKDLEVLGNQVGLRRVVDFRTAFERSKAVRKSTTRRSPTWFPSTSRSFEAALCRSPERIRRFATTTRPSAAGMPPRSRVFGRPRRLRWPKSTNPSTGSGSSGLPRSNVPSPFPSLREAASDNERRA